MPDKRNLIKWKQDNKNVLTRRWKYVFLFFSYVLWITGTVFVTVGAWSISQLNGYRDISDFAFWPSAILAALGVVIFIVSTIGVMGIARQNLCLLRTYRICLILILVFEICAGLVGFAFWPELKKVIDSNVNRAIENYADDYNLHEMIDMIQRKLECCGSLSIDDWDSNPYYRCKKVGSYRSCGVPWSCCLENLQRNRLCGLKIRRNRLNINLPERIHTIGCLDKLFEYMKSNMYLIGVLAIVCNLPLLICMVLAQKMIKRVRKLIISYNEMDEKYDWTGNTNENTTLNATDLTGAEASTSRGDFAPVHY